MMKIFENLGIMIMVYLVGYIRVNTVGFFSFHIAFSLVSLIATALSYHYYQKKERRFNDKQEKNAKDAVNDDDDEKKQNAKVGDGTGSNNSIGNSVH